MDVSFFALMAVGAGLIRGGPDPVEINATHGDSYRAATAGLAHVRAVLVPLMAAQRVAHGPRP